MITYKKRFSYAIQGIVQAIKEEPNLKFHIVAAVLVILAGWFFSLSRVEWLFTMTAIGGMIALELMNSAVERVVDLYTKNFHPLAKAAKDMAAGAVLAYAVYSVCVGLVIFLPKVYGLFTG